MSLESVVNVETNIIVDGEKSTKLSVGTLLDQTFSFFFKKIAMVSAVGTAVVLLNYLLLVLIEQLKLNFTSSVISLTVLTYLISSVIYFFSSGIITLKCYACYHNVETSISDIFSCVSKKINKLFFAGILSGLAIGLAFACFIVPGVFVMLSLNCLFPILYIENLTLKESWKRSFALTKGFRWKIALFYLLHCLPVFGLVLMLIFASSIFGKIDSKITNQLIQSFLGCYTVTFYQISLTFLYFQLREKKEGFDLEMLSRIADTDE